MPTQPAAAQKGRWIVDFTFLTIGQDREETGDGGWRGGGTPRWRDPRPRRCRKATETRGQGRGDAETGRLGGGGDVGTPQRRGARDTETAFGIKRTHLSRWGSSAPWQRGWIGKVVRPAMGAGEYYEPRNVAFLDRCCGVGRSRCVAFRKSPADPATGAAIWS